MLSRLRDWVGRGATGDAAARRALARAQAALDGRDLAAARAHLERAALAAPQNGDVLARCGTLLAGAGHAAEAVPFLERAHALLPGDAALALALAEALRASGRLAAARTLAQALLARDPADAGALLSLGRALLADGAAAAARGAFERLAARAPADATAAHGLALALHAEGRAEDARITLARCLETHPDDVPALELAGALALERGDAAGALAWLARAADLAPDNAGVQSNLGLAYLRTGRREEAIETLQLALHQRPELVAAQVNLGLAHLEAKEWDEAEQAFAGALARAPGHAQALAGRARALQGLYRMDDAAAAYERALAAAPSAELWTRLGQVYRELGRYGDAQAAFESALAVDPAYASALVHVGIVALDHLDLGRAIACFERALGSEHDDEAKWNITCARLLVRDWPRAWDHYSLRWKSPDSVPRPYRFPEWSGEDLGGRTLLVYAEQGLGDEIMFASCYAELAARGARLVIECAPKLERLFARSFPDAVVVGRDQAGPADWLERAPRIDLQAACGTVASRLRRSAASFPAHSGYLRADPGRVAYWRARLDALGPGAKIGLSWRGGTTRTRRRLRSISLDDWRPVIGSPGTTVVSLQYHRDAAGEADAYRRATGLAVHHWQDAIHDYDETAALVCALDAVVSVCTAVVHLGGALGRPVYVVVPRSPEWRYGLEGDAMPWYPSVKLFRQGGVGEWSEPIARIRDAVLRRDAAGALGGQT
jgi:tetratricopeptide (TPR) repeat protein